MSDLQHSTLQFERNINATPDHLFNCLTQGDKRQIWNSPGEGQVVIIDTPIPATPGVRETSRVGPAENPYATVHADWIILTPGERVVYAETIAAEGMDLGVTLVVCEITPRDSGCQLSIHLQLTSFVGEEFSTQVGAGWTHAVDALVKFVDAA
ncbi:MAG: hypothetical protein ACPGRD_02445 [Planktomarina sp.]